MKKRKPSLYRHVMGFIANQEGKKHQASMGDVMEIGKITCFAIYRDPRFLLACLKNGERLAKSPKKSRCR